MLLEVANHALLRPHRLQELHLLFLDQVSVSLNVLDFLLEDSELLLHVLLVFLLDLIPLFALLQQPDLFVPL